MAAGRGLIIEGMLREQVPIGWYRSDCLLIRTEECYSRWVVLNAIFIDKPDIFHVRFVLGS